MYKILNTKELLYEVRNYLQAELRAWRESGSDNLPSIIESLLEDIDKELRLGMCTACGGPMVIHPLYEVPFCGSWLYMEGGCVPAPILRVDRTESYYRRDDAI